MPLCFHVSDLHGSEERYAKLLETIESERPRAVFLGGDLLPSGLLSRVAVDPRHRDFVNSVLVPRLHELRERLERDYPRLLVILGNDDPRSEEPAILDAATRGYLEYVHERRVHLDGFDVYGYACIPPSPFLMKDWERYDVSRHVDVGAVSPEEGWRSVPVEPEQVRWGTMEQDLSRLVGERSLERSVLLFHAPPYRTPLDRAALDGRLVDGVPVDVHVGSIAVQRFLQARQPLVSLHGHVHEAAGLSGDWKVRIGRTWCLGAAHDGPELALVRFDPEVPAEATRELL